MLDFRFEVAFSFAGPHRDKVRAVAELVAAELGKQRVFFDEWYEAEILGSDMDVLLQRIYLEQSLMVVADHSGDYADRMWTQAEARAIRALRMKIDTARDETARLRLLNILLGPGEVPGIFITEGYLDGLQKTAEQCAQVILERHALLVSRQPPAAPTATAAPVGTVPAPRENLFGRDELLARLEAEMRARLGKRGLCLTGVAGMGGVGKTELALVLAQRLADVCPDRQLLFDLLGTSAAPLTPAAVLEKVLRTFHPEAQLPEAVPALRALLEQTLRERIATGCLLILDNARDAAQVAPLLQLPRTSVIVTTRWEIDLDGLKLEPVEELEPLAAQQLLTEETRGRLTAGTPAVVEAAKLCGRLPVALLAFAAAVRTEKRPVNELLTLLRERREAKTMKAVDAVFSLSEALLPEPLPTRWHQLGIFPTSFDRPAAAAIWAEEDEEAAQRDLNLLCGASLLRWVEKENRFILHDLARQYCESRLPAAARDEARLRHARHYIAVGQEADRLYLQGGEHVLAGLQLFDHERTHIEAAFSRLQTREDELSAALLVSLVDAVAYAGDLRFHPRQRIDWLEAQCTAARLAGDRAAEGRALGNLGNAYADLGDARKAIELHEQALVIARELGDRRAEGRT
ncbi:MAG TPA: hypothetical protein VGO11_11545 [Chthoniobacteraceae bacterium]|jgi:hypothetical protein|nr:hypothetical protein [Chthoniobacteraceae bacterium]